jgi:hemerythrin superfamily protein
MDQEKLLKIVEILVDHAEMVEGCLTPMIDSLDAEIIAKEILEAL